MEIAIEQKPEFKKRQIGTRLSPSMYKELEKLAKIKKVDISKLVRAILEAWILQEKK